MQRKKVKRFPTSGCNFSWSTGGMFQIYCYKWYTQRFEKQVHKKVPISVCSIIYLTSLNLTDGVSFLVCLLIIGMLWVTSFQNECRKAVHNVESLSLSNFCVWQVTFHNLVCPCQSFWNNETIVARN